MIEFLKGILAMPYAEAEALEFGVCLDTFEKLQTELFSDLSDSEIYYSRIEACKRCELAGEIADCNLFIFFIAECTKVQVANAAKEVQ